MNRIFFGGKSFIIYCDISVFFLIYQMKLISSPKFNLFNNYNIFFNQVKFMILCLFKFGGVFVVNFRFTFIYLWWTQRFSAYTFFFYSIYTVHHNSFFKDFVQFHP